MGRKPSVQDNYQTFLISIFRRVLNIVCSLLGNSPASEFYMLTFRNTLFHRHTYPHMKMEKCSETSAYKIQTPGNYPEESIHFLTYLVNTTLCNQFLPMLHYRHINIICTIYM